MKKRKLVCRSWSNVAREELETPLMNGRIWPQLSTMNLQPVSSIFPLKSWLNPCWQKPRSFPFTIENKKSFFLWENSIDVVLLPFSFNGKFIGAHFELIKLKLHRKELEKLPKLLQVKHIWLSKVGFYDHVEQDNQASFELPFSP